MSKSVSFIIPHKGREEMLLQTVESIFRQDVDLREIEIIIVTQNEKLAIAPEVLDKSVNVEVVYADQKLTISTLRNIGAQKAQGDHFAFLDADVDLSPNWLKTMKQLLQEKPQRKLVSAMQINSQDAPILEQIRTLLSNAELDCNVNFLPGCNLFLAKNTFVQVSGFPEHLSTCEDSYFADKVNQIGELYRSSQAGFVHLGEDKSFGQLLRKEAWRARSNLQSIKGRRISMREMPSFLVPPTIAICLIGSATSLFLGYLVYGIVLLLISLLPVCVYALRLYRLANEKVSFVAIIRFYFIYFLARAYGALSGIMTLLIPKKSS